MSIQKVPSSTSIYVVISGGKLRIPVNPQQIDIEYPTDHKTYEVLGLGEIIVPRKPSLKKVSWESFFPSGNDPYVNSGVKGAGTYEKLFKGAMENKTVVRLIITRSGLYDTNMKCIISSFKTSDKGGEPEDMYYNVELTEYRAYEPQVVKILQTPAQEEGAVQATAEPQRDVETPVLRVGANVIANGKYWYDSFGASPSGTANNLSTTVTRIVEGNPYPVHIGSYGWLSESQLQIVG